MGDTDKGFKFSWYKGDKDGSEEAIIKAPELEEKNKFCGGTLTEMDCCGAAGDRKCGYGQGDCDADEECAEDLRCGRNNCIEFRSWAEPTADCCVTIPKPLPTSKVNVSAINDIIKVNLSAINDSIKATTICSLNRECDLPPNKLKDNDFATLTAWNVKIDSDYQNIEFSFEVLDAVSTRKAENHRRNWKKLKSGRGNKDRGRTGNKNKINGNKISKNMLKGTKGNRDTLKGKRKKNVHKGGRHARSMKNEKKGKKNKNKGKS